jgi:hypothetical protein
LQADELMHVKLATRWIPELLKDKPAQMEDLVRWSRESAVKVQDYYGGQSDPAKVRLSFLKPDAGDGETAGGDAGGNTGYG